MPGRAGGRRCSFSLLLAVPVGQARGRSALPGWRSAPARCRVVTARDGEAVDDHAEDDRARRSPPGRRRRCRPRSGPGTQTVKCQMAIPIMTQTSMLIGDRASSSARGCPCAALSVACDCWAVVGLVLRGVVGLRGGVPSGQAPDRARARAARPWPSTWSATGGPPARRRRHPRLRRRRPRSAVVWLRPPRCPAARRRERGSRCLAVAAIGLGVRVGHRAVRVRGDDAAVRLQRRLVRRR